jgi:hypothetical protein
MQSGVTGMKATSKAAKIQSIEQLESLRNKMIQTANTFGIQHPMVLNYSRKIDETHNNLIKLQQSEK